LQLVRELRDFVEAERRGHALDRVRGPERAIQRVPAIIHLERRKAAVQRGQVLLRLGQVEVTVAAGIHRSAPPRQPSTRCTASSTRAGWNGFTMKSRAPAWIAPTTGACCPIALHLSMGAFGCSLMISRTASIPPMSGMTMSIVTRSGCSSRYFATASVPVSASPTTSNPASRRMSPSTVRMKIASSQINTVRCMTPPLVPQSGVVSLEQTSEEMIGVEQEERRTVVHADADHVVPFDVQCAQCRRIDGQIVDRGALHAEHSVHREGRQPLILREVQQTVIRALTRAAEAERAAQVEDRDHSPPQVRQPGDFRAAPGQPS